MLFFTSDQHWGHENIIKFCDRPFSDVTYMREWMVTRWNETVGPEDTVMVLGDWAIGNREETLTVGHRLNGHKLLIKGNHDDMSKKYNEQTYLDSGFDAVGGMDGIDRVLHLGPYNIRVNHFPYVGDSREGDRFSEHRPPDDGKWLLHGHVHTEWLQRDRMINVGVDAWGGIPVSEDTIMQLIDLGPQDVPIQPWKKGWIK